MAKNDTIPSNYKTGFSLGIGTQVIGGRLKVPQDIRNKIKTIDWNRGTFLMELRNKGVVVNDPNNMYEIISKYATIHPELPTPPPQMTEAAMNPKSFDFGGFTELLGGLVDTIASGINSGNVQAFLTNWATQFAQYMRDDMGNIQNTLTATEAAPGPWGGWGARGALDMLLRFKKTSWRDLKNTITSYCSSKQVDVPAPVKALWTQQEDLERDLRAQINGVNPGHANTSNSSGEPLTAVAGAGTGFGDMFSGGSGSFMKYLPWIIVAFVVLIIIILVIVAARGGKSKVTVKNK